MKKSVKAGILIAVLAVFSAFTAQASYVQSSYHITPIPNARIIIDTQSIEAGADVRGDAASYVSVPDNSYYTFSDAEWLDNVETIRIGDTPRMRVYLNVIPKEVDYEHYTKIWLFQGGYTASNVTITGGTYLSASIRDSGYTLEVLLTLKPVKGQYSEPASVYWDTRRGLARWLPSEGSSGVYDVFCYRNGGLIKKVTSYSGDFYDFYPYMTREGDYTFKVRSVVPADIKTEGIRPSEFAESGSLYLTESEVSDGSGKQQDNGNIDFPNGTGNEAVAGWLQDGGYWYFRYPNGTYASDGWLKLNGTWYLLGPGGRMLTGWQKDPKTGLWYYLDPQKGSMKTGWFYDDGHWYYLNTVKDSTEGRMLTGWLDLNGRKYYFNTAGIMVTGWYEIDGGWYYFYPQGSAGGQYGYMAANTTVGDFRIGADGRWIQ